MKQHKRKIIGFLSVFALLCVIAPMVTRAADAGAEDLPTLWATPWALLPAVVAIALALITKETAV